jgi:iron(III) transport system substrate-binding protein
MFKNHKFLVTALVICFLVGTFSVAQGKGLPADVEKWLKATKIGPFQKDKVDYGALYKAAKKEGTVVVYASSSRGPKSFALGFYDKYPGIKVEWNMIGTAQSISRLIAEQKAGIFNVDLMFCSDYPTHVNVLVPSNMVFPWVPPDLREVIPREWQHPVLVHRLSAHNIFYNYDSYPDKPPIDSWWDMTKPEWKGRLIMVDPRISKSSLQTCTALVLNSEEMAKDYGRVFGKPLKLTTPNAGYEFIKMLFANKPRFVKDSKEASYIGKAGLKNAPLGINWPTSRLTDSGNPKKGNLQWGPIVTLKPRIGHLYPSMINFAYKAPHPNATKLVIRWLLGDEEGGGGMAPWYVPGYWPARTDVKGAPAHPFVTRLSYPLKDLSFWFQDAKGIWEKEKEVLEFINKNY